MLRLLNSKRVDIPMIISGYTRSMVTKPSREDLRLKSLSLCSGKLLVVVFWD